MARGWFAISPPLGGTLDADIKKAVATLLGQLPSSAIMGVTLDPVVASMIGGSPPSGILDVTLDKSLANLVGAQVISSQMAVSLKKVVLAGAGGQAMTGTIAAQLNKAIFDGSGSHYNNGILAPSVAKVLAAFNGSQLIPGILDADLKSATANMGEGQIGSMSVQFKKLISSMTAEQIFAGNLAAPLKKTTANMGGAQTLSGSIASAMKKINFAGSGIQAQSGTAAATLKKAVAAMAGNQSTGVQRIALGTGQYTTGAGGTLTINIPITIPGGVTGNAILMVGIICGHNGWGAYPSGTSSLTMSSATIDSGAQFSRQSAASGSTGISGQDQGDVHIFSKVAPPSGSHTIAVSFTVSSFAATVLGGQAACYDSVASLSNGAYNRVNQGSALSQNIASGTGDMVFYCGGHDGDPAGFNGTTLYENGAITGNATTDYILVGEKAGEADNSVNLATTSTFYAGAGVINLESL